MAHLLYAEPGAIGPPSRARGQAQYLADCEEKAAAGHRSAHQNQDEDQHLASNEDKSPPGATETAVNAGATAAASGAESGEHVDSGNTPPTALSRDGGDQNLASNEDNRPPGATETAAHAGATAAAYGADIAEHVDSDNTPPKALVLDGGEQYLANNEDSSLPNSQGAAHLLETGPGAIDPPSGARGQAQHPADNEEKTAFRHHSADWNRDEDQHFASNEDNGPPGATETVAHAGATAAASGAEFGEHVDSNNTPPEGPWPAWQTTVLRQQGQQPPKSPGGGAPSSIPR